MIVPSGNGSFPSRAALIAKSLPRIARRSLRLPSSWATEISFQSRYPAGIFTPKIGDVSSSACPDANGRAARMVNAIAIASISIVSHFIGASFHALPATRLEGASQLSFGDVDDGLGKGLRRFLRQVMTDAASNRPVLVVA